MTFAVRIAPGDRADLSAIDPRADGGLTRAEGEARLADLAAELADLQDLLAAAETHALLIVLQGPDCSGKDGAVRRALAGLNPAALRVVAFKPPTRPEQEHDVLWRVHAQTPARGEVVVFNRSHYEEVLVPRVRGLVPAAIWRDRYNHINAFERLLTASDTLLLKCYLHISKEEQEERLLKREGDVTKAWKLDPVDWAERRNWDAYRAAYEDALTFCSTEDAPWHVLPADRKWFRNVALADLIAAHLRPHRDGWLRTLEERARVVLPGVRAARENAQASTAGKQ